MRLPRLLIVLTVFFSPHYYIWARLVRDTELPQPWFALLTAVIFSLALGVPLGMLTMRQRRKPGTRALMAANYAWMGVFFITLSLLTAVDLVHGLLFLGEKLHVVANVPTTLGLLRQEAQGVAVAAVALAAYAFYAALTGPKVKKVTVPLGRWPKGLNGLKIAQISDLHVAPLLGVDYVRRVVERTNALNPDIIAITGDLVDGTVEQLRESAAPLADLRARLGVFYITGNHEFYWDGDAWVAEARRLGMRPLRAEHCTLESGPCAFDIAGVDDISAGKPDDIARAMQGRDPARAVILLAHQPRVVDAAAAQNVDLLLCGHTHGGQIWPFGLLVRLQQPYVTGLAKHGPTQIYVNRGTGYWGPPMRLGGASEITLLTLQSTAG